jgi:regulator of RNase E activity RraB
MGDAKFTLADLTLAEICDLATAVSCKRAALENAERYVAAESFYALETKLLDAIAAGYGIADARP